MNRPRVVALSLGIALRVGAQPSASYVQEAWTVRDGLPVNTVEAVHQARDGYLWIATLDGLVRFDGVRFTIYNASNSALPSNRIVRIDETRDGTLWLATEPGHLVRFRRDTFVVVGHVAANVGALIVEDARGTVWVGTDRGLFVARDTQLVSTAPDAIHGGVTALLARRNGSLFVATADGVHRVTAATTRVERVLDRARIDGDRVIAMREDRDGTLWLATTEAVWRWRDSLHAVVRGLATYAADVALFPDAREVWVGASHGVYRVGVDAPHQVARVSTGVRGFLAGLVFADASGRVYWADGDRLWRDGRGARDELVASFPSQISSATFDREGSLWVGTQNRGMYRIKPAPVRMVAHAPGGWATVTYPVLAARDGSMWYGTAAGELVNVRQGAPRVFHPTTASVPWIRALHEDRAGRLWIGGFGEVRICEPTAMRCGPLPEAGPLASFAGSVMAIHEDADGTMWIGTDGGLYRRDHGAWHTLGAAAGAPTAGVRAFLRTRDGALWLGTIGGGLARWDGTRFRAITTRDGLPSNFVRALYQDADGWLWIGTEGRGVARLDPREWIDSAQHGRIASIAQRDGLYDDVVHVILEDEQGRLWFNGNRGISWVDRRALVAFADGKVPNVVATSYTERDGMRNREGNGGSQPAGVRARDGTLWFPTQDGVAVVDPARIRRNVVPPPVAVEAVTAQGADGRDLEIAYTAMSFLAPANVRFRYRLEPYDRDWIDAGARRTAFYTRVPPGDYTFRVVASNNDGVWNTVGASHAIVITPHLWETTPFRVVVACILIGLTALGVQWRVRSLRGRALALERIVDDRTRELRDRNAQLAELHESRSRLFANLSHEFRTPLTLILGPVRSLLDGRYGPVAPTLREQAELMQRNGQRLLRLINQVLDLARLQAGAVALDRQPRDLAAFARATTLAFAPLAERRRVTLGVRTGEEPLVVAFDAEQLEKVLLNLLSNALKFTEPGGAVDVCVARDGGDACVSVRDTGVGISAEQLPRVFDRFYQADASTTRRYEGTGIGLALARELVELHGGTIAVESALGTGSTFTVRLPLGDATATVAAVRDRNAALDTDAHEATEPPELAVTEEHAVADVTTVLLVDDNADVRAFVRSLLVDRYRVIEASDGQMGLAMARAELPDLIVADVMMPQLDGLSLGRALKDDAMTDAIPVVLLSARAATEDQVAGLETGADAYLTKPFEPAVLVATVASLLAQRRRLRARFGVGTDLGTDLGDGFEGRVREPVPEVRPPNPSPKPVPTPLDARLRPLVDARLADPDLDANALAAAAGLSYHQLYRALRDELAMSPSRYIRTVRVEHAAELLRTGAGTVTEIAYSVGFESLSYFSRAFHERFGAAPSSFARRPASR